MKQKIKFVREVNYGQLLILYALMGMMWIIAMGFIYVGAKGWFRPIWVIVTGIVAYIFMCKTGNKLKKMIK